MPPSPMPPTESDLHHRAPALHGLPEPLSLEDQLPGECGGNDPKRKVVGVDGKWYDVTDFISRHPGGPVIEQFIGKDATTVFHAYGHAGVLKHRRPVGSYTMPVRHPADIEFDQLTKKFEKEGYFVTDFRFYIMKLCFAFSLLGVTIALVTGFSSWWAHMLGAVALAFHWQQIGFIMHEFMHTQVFRDRKIDHLCGVFTGTLFFGFSAHWWQDEHIVHHAMTNTVDGPSNFADPQMWESVWAQNTKLFPLFPKSWLARKLISIQHITFVPAVIFIGRIEILTDSYRVEKRPIERLAMILHWVWMCCLLSFLPTWTEVFTFYALAATVEGIFHFQLILSHYCKEFFTVPEFHQSSWYLAQIASNMNIDTPWWQDWYYGGLNYHIEHHLWPRMGRQSLKRAAPYVKEICAKHGIHYENVYFYKALTMTLSHLKTAGTHYELEFR